MNPNVRSKRITPAGAGKTSGCRHWRHDCWDHPRRCGENLSLVLQIWLPSGSPPQVRGKLNSLRSQVRYLRITPAGAGKTGISPVCAILAKDHPRRCGENLRCPHVVVDYRGSPPQVRGKPYPPPWGLLFVRITPAGAGKTNERNRKETETRDHPRRCGENVKVSEPNHANKGSPPQVRGKLNYRNLRTNIRRITPAGAGKTISVGIVYSKIRDHPRRCGENPKISDFVLFPMGSPPQVRGKRPCGSIAGLILGITPAGAGKTFIRRMGTAQAEDHPRRCGENFIIPLITSFDTGSPPQVRGKRNNFE